MATVTLGGNPVHTLGELPTIGSELPNFELTATDLSVKTNADFKGQRLILSIFPSIDTPTCATSVRAFNAKAAQLPNTKVLCISKDLPFAQKRFCGAEGLDNVICLADFKNADFGTQFGLTFTDGPLTGLLSRAVIVADENGRICYEEQVAEIAHEPNYEAALASLA
ncbi:MAG: lipid hydroperoxide peroxidase [Flavobacterium sp. BFFFF2]|nr:MAG: lipid hydroperoxide peroxidase [Flavobacterium sp. BFFFF2]